MLPIYLAQEICLRMKYDVAPWLRNTVDIMQLPWVLDISFQSRSGWSSLQIGHGVDYNVDSEGLSNWLL